jgi:hypothetical protein
MTVVYLEALAAIAVSLSIPAPGPRRRKVETGIRRDHA